VEPVLIKALNIIDNALEQAEDGDEDEVAQMTSKQKVGGIQADMSKDIMFFPGREEFMEIRLLQLTLIRQLENFP